MSIHELIRDRNKMMQKMIKKKRKKNRILAVCVEQKKNKNIIISSEIADFSSVYVIYVQLVINSIPSHLQRAPPGEGGAQCPDEREKFNLHRDFGRQS